jgi:hypothetical protein
MRVFLGLGDAMFGLIGAATRGIPRPASVIEKLRLANLGKKASAKTRRKMSNAHRSLRSHPPICRVWTNAEDSLVKESPAKVVAERTGLTLTAAYSPRLVLDLPDGRSNTLPFIGYDSCRLVQWL